MRVRLYGIAFSVSFVFASAGVARAQETQYLHARIESQLPQVDRSASELLTALVSQPKDVRDAAMVVAEHPDLAIRLKYADRSPEGLNSILKDYPAQTADAARSLATRSDVIELLARNPAGTAVLGRVYAEQRDVAIIAMDRISERRIEQRQETSEAWTRRLESTDGAAAQLASMPGIGAMEAGKPPLPSGDRVIEILQNADQNAELAAAIVDQWENERNPEEFRQAVDIWYAKGRDVLPWDFSGDAAERAALLSEYARFDRQYREILATGELGLDRLTLLSQNADAFPKLIDVYYDKQEAIAAASKPKIAGAPFTSGGGGSSRSSSRSSARSGGTRSRSSTNRSSSRQNRNSNESQGNDQGGFGGNGGFGGQGGQGGFGNSGSGFGSSGGGGFGSSSGGFGSSGGGFGSSGSSSSRNNQSNSNR